MASKQWRTFSIGSAIIISLSIFYQYFSRTEFKILIDHETLSFNVSSHDTPCYKLAVELPSSVFSSRHEAYAASSRAYFSQQAVEAIPRCIVKPKNADEVSNAVRILKRDYDAQIAQGLQPLQFAVRSGGHSLEAGMASVKGGALIDLSHLNSITILDLTSVTIGTGARWKDVYSKLDEHGLTVAGGRASTVGVGGLILGGGISFFSPQVGFVSSNIIEYEIVLANGTVTTVSSVKNLNLFRSLKGGSNNFGIVTRITTRAFPSTKLWGGVFYSLGSKAQQALDAFDDFADPETFDEKAAGPITVFAYVNLLWGWGLTFATSNLMYTRPTPWPPCFRKFQAIRRLWTTAKVRTLNDATREIAESSPAQGRQFQAVTTVKHDPATLRAAHEVYLQSLKSIRHVKGLIYSLVFQQVPVSVMAKDSLDTLGLASRKEPLVIILISASWKNAADDGLVEEQSRDLINEIDALAIEKGTDDPFRYLNYAASGQKVLEGYGPENLKHMKATRNEIDPTGFFQRACVGGFKLGMDN